MYQTSFMAYAFESRVLSVLLSVCLLSCFIVSFFFSLLKLEECIKLLSWPMPLSWEYQLSAARLLLSLASPLFLNWKNVLNFFHGPCLWVESITSLLPCYTASCYLSLLKLEECIKLLSWPMPLSWEYQLSADQLLLSLATSLFLNWKNVLNFFHGPSL